MTDAPKPTLTEAERCNLGSFTDGTYACASEAYCSGYDDNRPGHMHENLYDCVTNIVATHVAVARREALLEAAECPSDEWGITWQSRARRLTAEVKRLRAKVARVEALAERYEAMERDEGYGGELWSTTASAIRKTLAEPERDEEGR